MQRVLKISSIAIVSLVILITVLHTYLARRYENKHIAHQKHYTTTGLINEVCNVISISCINSQQLPPEDMNLMLTWLQKNVDGKHLSPILKYIKNGQIVDSWSNPVQLHKSPSGEYIVYSYGINGRDEKCEGDDICKSLGMIKNIH